MHLWSLWMASHLPPANHTVSHSAAPFLLVFLYKASHCESAGHIAFNYLVIKKPEFLKYLRHALEK